MNEVTLHTLDWTDADGVPGKQLVILTPSSRITLRLGSTQVNTLRTALRPGAKNIVLDGKQR